MRGTAAHPYRRLVVLTAACLAGAGFLVFLSAASRPEGGFRPHPLTQLAWLGLAAGAAWGVARLDYRSLLRWSPWLYGALLLVLAGVTCAAPPVNGARRWLPLFGFTFQPSEPLKAAWLLMAVQLLGRSAGRLGWRVLALTGGVTLPPVVLLLAQPDLGTALVYCAAAGGLVWVAGLPRRLATGLGVLAAVLIPVGYRYGLRDYQRARIQAFLSWDEAGSAAFELYQPLMARIAVANGGWTGQGLFRGPQTRAGRIPAAHNDYLLAVAAEEGGVVAVATFLGLMALLLALLLGAAREYREPRGRLLLVGTALLLVVQAWIHAGVATGALPTTGLTFPLASYGGSSLMASGLLLGLALAVLGRRVPDLSPERVGEPGPPGSRIRPG